MKTIKFRNLATLLLALAILFTACEKEKNIEPDSISAEDDALATHLFEDIFAEVDDALESMEAELYSDGLKSAEAVICKTISIERPNDTTFWPRTVTIDYGDGCTGKNGKTRKGKVIIEVNGRYIMEDFYRTVRFEDFYINDFKLEGVRTVSNEGRNENGNIIFSVILEGGKVISPEGREVSKDAEHVREWVAGSETPRRRIDDEYMITGMSTGINRNQEAYTRTIIDPLYKTRDCIWIRSGSIQIEAEGRETAILDYGDGSCDRLATISIGDKTKTIRLHQ